MKKLYFLLFTFLITSLSFGQTTVFQESFESGNSGTPSETCNDNGSDFFTRTDGSDISSSYQVSGMDGTFFFAAQDTDGSPCTMSTETLTFTNIDISTFSDMTFAVLVAEDDATDMAEDWDANTSVLFEINIDGGGYTNLIQFSGGGATNTEPGLDSDFDGTADGTALTSSFQEFTAAVGNGSSADLRITFSNLDAGDEDIAIDDIRIIDGFVAAPTITITSPTNGTVLPPGTTNVNVEWTTANLSGGETVDVTVNASTSNNETSPFALATTDGQTYNVTVELIDGGVVASDAISFSVASLNVVSDIAALRADVGTNGLGRYYEITGASLVTHTDSFNNRKWIQDSNISGILIYDQSGTIVTTYNIGDNVTGLKGYTDEQFDGVLRFIPFEDSGVVSSTGNPVTPQTVTITNFNTNYEDYESELVELQNVSFDDGDGVATFSTGTNYNVSDAGMNTVVKRTDYFSANYIGEIIPSSNLTSLVAIAGEFNGTAQIYVRSLSDFTLNNENFDDISFSVYPNPTSLGYVNITSRSSSTMQVNVFDVLGKQVINTKINDSRLDVSSLNVGVYIMRVSQDDATTTKKLVIK